MAQAVDEKSQPNLPNGISFDGHYYNWNDIDSGKYLDRVQGTDTSDNLRQGDTNPVYVKFTDAQNREQKITISSDGRQSSLTLWFPVSNKEIIWYHPGGKDRTGFDVDCSWGQIKFSYIDNGIKVNFVGYKRKDAGVAKVDWETVDQWVKTGKDVSEAIKNGAEAYAAASSGGAAAAAE